MTDLRMDYQLREEIRAVLTRLAAEFASAQGGYQERVFVPGHASVGGERQ
jgi:hypothetical protein